MVATKTLMVCVCVLQFLSGCGPKVTEGVVESEQGTSHLTNGRSEDGIAYTSFSPGRELGDLKSRILPGNPNAEKPIATSFSQDVSSVRKQWLFRSGQKLLAVEVEFKDQKRTRFVGSVGVSGAASGRRVVGTLLPEGGTFSDVRVDAACDDPECNVLVGAFVGPDSSEGGRTSGGSKEIGGFILREEDRLAEESWAPDESKSEGEVSAAGGSPSEASKLTVPVHVSSMEVVGGPAKISLSSVKDSSGGLEQIEVPLLETDGECLSIADEREDESSTCLMGNSQDGEVVLSKTVKVASRGAKRKFIRVLPRETPSSQASASPARKPLDTGEQRSRCSDGVLDADSHPWVREALRACGRPEVQAEVRYWSRTGEKPYLERFLQLRSGTGANASFEQAFQLMLNELRRRRMPEVTALISYNESRFQPHRRSSAHAVGWWQLVPATARENGLKLWPKDERTDITLSTQAAARYLDMIGQIPAWKGNLAMTLAAYNMGHNGLARSVQATERRHRQRLSLTEISGFSTDFWTLSRLRVLPRETRNYVPRIFSAMSISLKPAHYGLNGPAFPAD